MSSLGTMPATNQAVGTMTNRVGHGKRSTGLKID